MQGTAVNWTREQSQVIESRGKNLLVSAAAGSGKTAVLVERIIRMVTEGENPPGIDVASGHDVHQCGSRRNAGADRISD